jgi:hypothetical protein
MLLAPTVGIGISLLARMDSDALVMLGHPRVRDGRTARAEISIAAVGIAPIEGGAIAGVGLDY